MASKTEMRQVWIAEGLALMHALRKWMKFQFSGLALSELFRGVIMPSLILKIIIKTQLSIKSPIGFVLLTLTMLTLVSAKVASIYPHQASLLFLSRG